MGAPKRLRLDVDKFHVSAVLLPEVPAEQAETVVCKDCAPQKTKIKHQITLVQEGFDHDKCWAVFQCKSCAKQWALPYRVEHSIREVGQ
jgi:hypothetical protein